MGPRVDEVLNRYLDELHELEVPAERIDAVEAFVTPVSSDGALDGRIKMVMLFLAASAVGNDREATRAMGAALDRGLSRQQLLDALLTGALCRGVAVLWDGMEWLRMAPLDPDSSWGPSVSGATPEEMSNFLVTQNPSASGPVRELASAAPSVLKAYYTLRSTVLVDGPLARRHKELMLVVINAAQRFEPGVAVHLEAALAHGASEHEVAEALLVAAVVGGIPAWQAGSSALADRRGP